VFCLRAMHIGASLTTRRLMGAEPVSIQRSVVDIATKTGCRLVHRRWRRVDRVTWLEITPSLRCDHLGDCSVETYTAVSQIAEILFFILTAEDRGGIMFSHVLLSVVRLSGVTVLLAR